MVNIDDHQTDPYIADFMARRESGSASPLDRANACVLNASQARVLVSESDESVKAAADAAFERVLLAATACATATRLGSDVLAEAFAQTADSEALVIDRFAYSKLDGLKRYKVHAA